MRRAVLSAEIEGRSLPRNGNPGEIRRTQSHRAYRDHGPQGGRATEWAQCPVDAMNTGGIVRTGRLAATLVACAVAGTTLLGMAPPASADATGAIAEAAFVADLNSLRASQGLSTLVVDPRLVTIAEGWSAQMAAAGSISHNPDLTTQAPSSWLALGENVGMGPDEPSLNTAFINSPHHYANMVDPVYNGVGVGVVMSSNSYMFVTVDFEELPAAPAPAAPAPTSTGAAVGTGSGNYWLAATDGGVFAYGGARFLGSMGGQHLNQPIAGMAATPSGNGYWLVARDGGIFSYGDAGFYGSTGGKHLNRPIVGMAATPTGHGYWLVASDGGIFAFGDARFFGSTGSIALNKPIVGMATAPGGSGYWLVASDGGIFGFGAAGFFGSTAGTHLAQSIVGMTPTPSGQGYVLASGEGNVFAYGDSGVYGSPAGQADGLAVVGISMAAGGGYDLATGAGLSFTYSAAGSSQASTGPLTQPIVAIASLL
jgi:uncharacterized protein YkwD